MELAKIFSISGKPGLHQMIASSKNGVIVESLHDKKRFHAHADNKISSLEDITIYTETDDIALKDVLLKIGAANEFKAIEVPEKNALGSTLEEYLPEYDKERVYASDIKKMFKWYNILVDANLLKPEQEEEKEEKKEVKAKAPAKAAKKESPAKAEKK